MAGFRCDENIWKRFVPFSKAYYGSTCKAIKSILVALMEPVRSNFDDGLTPGYTLRDNPVPILQVENLHIHRNLGRERRNIKSEIDEASLIQLAAPFIEYYRARSWLSPGANQLYKDIGKDHPDLTWEQRKSLATIILKKLKEQ